MAPETQTTEKTDNRITITLDGVEMKIEPKKGQTIMQLCDELGIEIPRFCYHEELTIPANCRMCLVEVEKAPKLLPACHTTLMDGQVINTRNARVKRSQEAVLEFILVNHPIDCPICDQAGECPLQDQYAQYDARAARIGDPVLKVKKRKRVELGPRVTLDQERCILCSRCVRFMDEVAKEPQLAIFWRNDHAYLETFPEEPLTSNYSLNTVQICPVGALTSSDFRFRDRVWNLQTSAGICDGCDRGCNTWVDQKQSRVERLRARDNLAVNRYWMCDEGRTTYKFVNEARMLTPRHERGQVAPAGSSLELVGRLAEKVESLKGKRELAFLISPRVSTEDALATAWVAKELFGASRLYVGGREPGEADKILLREDRNPNRLGVKLAAEAFGLELKGFGALLEAVDGGEVTRLHAVGLDVPTDPQLVAGTFSGLNWFSCSATNLGPLVEQADIALPAATMVETEGTFVSAFGRAQRFTRAFEPRGEAAAHWEWLLELARALGEELDAEDPASLWAELGGRSPVLGSVEWGEVPAEGVTLDGVGVSEDDSQTGGRGVRHERGISRWPR
ncbi:MAG: 2Fe-2S iron-sulfur cluster-binding protein [Deltaproteobacteria bacterium]|nr:2Fe-2S iron-sulfur cluster-binding protein [Deltaproteobacteria bacterium]